MPTKSSGSRRGEHGAIRPWIGRRRARRIAAPNTYTEALVPEAHPEEREVGARRRVAADTEVAGPLRRPSPGEITMLSNAWVGRVLPRDHVDPNAAGLFAVDLGDQLEEVGVVRDCRSSRVFTRHWERSPEAARAPAQTCAERVEADAAEARISALTIEVHGFDVGGVLRVHDGRLDREDHGPQGEVDPIRRVRVWTK